MKIEDVQEGMKVKLRKNISKCTGVDGSYDRDLNKYEGGDIVNVIFVYSDGDVRVDKEGAICIYVDAKHLRKIK